MSKRTRKRTRGAKPVPQAPFRLCCGERHYGLRCGDGKMMCCLCYERFPMEDFTVLDDGCIEDVCQACNDVCQACNAAEKAQAQKIIEEARAYLGKQSQGDVGTP